MEVTYLDGCYISGRWVLHIWTTVTYLDGNKSARHKTPSRVISSLDVSTNKTYDTLLKIFKGTVMIFLCYIHRVNFIIFANVLNQLCRAFYHIIAWTNISTETIELTLFSMGWKKHLFPYIFWVVYMRIIVFLLEMIVSANIFRRYNPIRISCMHNKRDKYSQSNCYPGGIGSTCCSADWGFRHIISWTPNVMVDWIFTCA